MAYVSCFAPSNIVFNWNAGTSQLSVFWTGTAASYMIRYRTGTGNYTTLAAVAGQSAVISGLTKGNIYNFEFRANCSSGQSNPQYHSFLVPSTQAGPSNITMVQKSATSMTISWSGPAGMYSVVWQDMESMEVMSDITPNLTYTVTNLRPNVNYRITVLRMYLDQAIPATGQMYLDKDLCC